MMWFKRALRSAGRRLIRASGEITTGTGGLTASSLWQWITAPLSGWLSMDGELRSKLWYLRREARALALNNSVIRQYLELLRDNVIGPNGIRLQAQVRNNDKSLNKIINDKIETAWAGFWESPWADGRFSGIAGEQLLIKNLAVDGEVFIRVVTSPDFQYGIALQMLDPDLIDNNLNQPAGGGGIPTQNEIRLGIEVDNFGKPLAYWVWDRSPFDVLQGSTRNRIRLPAEEIIHIFDPERIGQTRGFTWFNTVMKDLKNLDGYVEAAIVAARTAACAVPIFRQTADFDQSEDQSGFNIELSPGSGFTLPQGLELQNWDPKHPNTNHSEFLKGCLRFTAGGLHVSYASLACDLSDANYSSMRSGLLIERDGYRTLQRLWIDRFRQPVFARFVWGALLSGGLILDSRDRSKFLSVKWVPRGWAWVDPMKDVNAGVIAIENGLDSRTRILAEQGLDFEEVCDELAEEKRISDVSGLDFSGAAVTSLDVKKQVEEELGGPTAPVKEQKNRLRLAVMNQFHPEGD